MGIIFTIDTDQWFLLPTMLLDCDPENDGRQSASLTVIWLCIEIGIVI